MRKTKIGHGHAVLGAVLVCAALVGCGSDAPGADTTGADTTGADTTDATASDAASDGLAEVEVTPPRRELRVMSYNVMCSLCVFDGHPGWRADWPARLPWLRDTIARHDPDLIGIQELNALDGANPDQVAAIGGDSDTYGAAFHHYVDGDPFEADYPDAVVYYRKARFELLGSGEFWLGPTPDVSMSHGFQSGPAFPRLVIWTTLHDRVTDRDLTFASTHFDNNAPNQVMSAPLALERFAPMAALRPVIFVGDFNSTPASEAFAILAHGKDGAGFHFDDALGLAGGHYRLDADVPPLLTWDEAERIDHIWLATPTGAFAVNDWGADIHAYGEKAQVASDHFAVFAELRLPE